MYDLIIIGGGPAGIAAAVYAARKRLKSLLIAEEVGGQSVVSEGIENWIGTPKISGVDMAKAFAVHLATVKGTFVELAVGKHVRTLDKTEEGFKVGVKGGDAFEARAVLIASGASRKKLEVPGAAEFENKGVTYCASCDGPLLAYAKSVTLLHRHKEFKADPITIENARAHENMRILADTEPTEVLGEQFVSGLKYLDKSTNEIKEVAVSGIFVEAGVIPNTAFAEEFLEMDAVKRIKVDPRNQRASVEGVWAAGDCTDELYHQNNIAAGDGVKALEDIYLWLKKR